MKKLLLTFSFAGALLGCSAPVSMPSFQGSSKLDALVGTVWLANGLLPAPTAAPAGAGAASAPASAPALRAPRLQFMSLTQVGGNAGCNGFGGPVVIKGDALQLGPLASTRKMCAGPEMAVERQFLANVDRVRKARLVGGHLELLDAADALVMRMTRAE